MEVDAFKQYATEGKLKSNYPSPSVSPPFRSWESRLSSHLGAYVAMRTCVVEAEALTSNAFPTTKWRSLFAATYLYSFSDIYPNFLWSVRFPDSQRPFDSRYDLVYHAAIGMVMGFREHALRLIRLHVLAHRLELFGYPQFYPAAQTLLRIFADYLGEPELTLKGEALTHAVYNALAKHWRHPEAEALAPLLLVVCDEHTRRNVRGKPHGDRCDFQYFARTPVEILLVFKLREELGLPNPHLDHPLMNTPLGVLPEEIPFEFDELLAPVVKRMREDGFDEKAILADFVAAVDAIR
jgi:hypothetical protein